jgi:hypothetical protein
MNYSLWPVTPNGRLRFAGPARIREGVKRHRGAAFMPLQRRHRTAAREFHGFLPL